VIAIIKFKGINDMTRHSNFGLTVKKAEKWYVVGGLAVLTLVGCSQAQPPEAKVEHSKATLVSAKQNTQSLENLQKAYNGESNAHVMYLAFADQAEEEGYQDGESYERDSMYPEFIEQAKAENDSAALQTFEYALAAETQHADLFSQAKGNLDTRKEASRSYYVCSISGETFDRQPEAEVCPSNPNGESLEQVI
jgi:rubrerythrin